MGLKTVAIKTTNDKNENKPTMHSKLWSLDSEVFFQTPENFLAVWRIEKKQFKTFRINKNIYSLKVDTSSAKEFMVGLNFFQGNPSRQKSFLCHGEELYVFSQHLPCSSAEL